MRSALVALALFPFAVVPLAACSSETTKEVTSAVVGKGVEVSKGAVKGLAEGIEEGRKKGESLDDAKVISTWDELEEAGRVEVLSVTSEGEQSTVLIGISNEGDAPLRISDLEVMGLDKDGYVIKPARPGAPSLTVPARAKDRLTVTLAGAQVEKVRIWGRDLDVP